MCLHYRLFDDLLNALDAPFELEIKNDRKSAICLSDTSTFDTIYAKDLKAEAALDPTNSLQ